MNTVITMRQSVYPALRYADAKAAIAWLTSVLEFKEHEVYPGEGDTIAHAQLQIAGNLIMLGSVKLGAPVQSPKQLGSTTGSIYIAFDTAEDVETLYRRASSAGADVVREIEDTDYGSREFGVRDPEGNLWSFGTYKPQASR